jgi:tRNA nucleotidyltransferase (CCA-adding enzyme)
VRFAVLVHDLGKGVTPDHILPRHIGHEERGLPLVQALCQRYRVPRDYQQLAEIVCEHHLECHRVMDLQAKTLWRKLHALDALRRPERFDEFLLACQADTRGRLGWEDLPYPQADYFRQARAVAAAITPKDLPHADTLSGPALGEALMHARIHALQQFKLNYHAQHPHPHHS